MSESYSPEPGQTENSALPRGYAPISKFAPRSTIPEKKPSAECYRTHDAEQALAHDHSNQSREERKKRIETGAEIKRSGARQRPSKCNSRDREGEAEHLHKLFPVEA